MGNLLVKKKFLQRIKNKVSSLENDYLENLIERSQISGKLFNNYFIDIGIKKI